MTDAGERMRAQISFSATATNAKFRLRPMISSGRAEPVAVAKRGRPVVVVMAVEELERLNRIERQAKGVKFE